MHNLSNKSITTLRNSFSFSFPKIVLLLFLSGLNACDCDERLNSIDDPQTRICESSESCENNQQLHFGKCIENGCQDDADCCPGTRCRTDIQSCWPLELDASNQCDSDTDCEDPAMRCREQKIGARDPVRICVYESCENDLNCGEERHCFEHICVTSTPCNGSCPSGKVCDVLTNSCHPVPEGSIGCSGSCDGIFVLENPENMRGESCCEIICACKALPNLIPIEYGAFASMAKTPSEILVSTYDSHFGDLLLLHYNKKSLKQTSFEYLDGFPQKQSEQSAGRGLRNGTLDPGENVGKYARIATNSQGLYRIAYYNSDQHSLKFASQNSAGQHKNYTLKTDTDTEFGDFGRGLDIAVNPNNGHIAISFYASHIGKYSDLSKNTKSGLYLARSKNASPKTAEDWTIQAVEIQEKFNPCGTACPEQEKCVLDKEALCRPLSNHCPTSCSIEQTCVELSIANKEGETTACLMPPLPKAHHDLERSTGLYSAITFMGDTVFISYYDANSKSLKIAKISQSGAITKQILDGSSESNTPYKTQKEDLGRHSSITTDGDILYIAYMDHSRYLLKQWSGRFGEPGTYLTVDDHFTTESSQEFSQYRSLLGAGSKIKRYHQKSILVYQDASQLDLNLAISDTNRFNKTQLQHQGAQGFYTDLLIDQQKAIILNVSLKLNQRKQQRLQLHLFSHSLQ